MSTEPSETENEEQTNDSSSKSVSLASSIQSNALLLGLFALGCTAFIALTYLSTDEEIEQRIREARMRALLEVVPAKLHDNDMLEDSLELFDEKLGHRSPQQLFFAKNKGKPRTVIYPATARDGYSGDINYIIGVNVADESIAGVRVLSHKETPGLGDKVDLRKSNWILIFNGKSLRQLPLGQWTVKKDGGHFDGFTGATITPRAVVKSVASVLEYHRQNAAHLIAQLNRQNNVQTSDSANPKSE